jgi:hypothetical protein
MIYDWSYLMKNGAFDLPSDKEDLFWDIWIILWRFEISRFDHSMLMELVEYESDNNFPNECPISFEINRRIALGE